MRAWRVSLLILLISLAACGGIAPKTTSYQPPPTPGGRLCTNQCREAQDYCRETCTLNQRSCTNQTQAEALRQYDDYTRARFTQHQPIDLHPRDFENLQLCVEAKESCTALCENHFQGCYEGCGGTVSESSTCQFLCF